MNRVAGIETEFGCLVAEGVRGAAEAWPARVKNHVFKTMRAGAIDLHYRDYEEPPGNGGFLRNGGRLYVDMGHLEYASPECRTLRDAVAYDIAGELLVQQALDELGAGERVAFIKNNIDHHTGATFGCHENYLMRREAHFTPRLVGVLLSFLATRQVFTGAGRVGQRTALAFDFEPPRDGERVAFQLSQRADHIVNDIYQWVQFNRAIINARDEPLADYRKYRRLHLLIGDSNMSPFATALKLGTTSLVLELIEENAPPEDVLLRDAVIATRQLSHAGAPHCALTLEDGRTRDAMDLQAAFLEAARARFAGRDEETDWVLESWAFTLDALERKPEALLGGVDWISKKWLLEQFVAEQGVAWDDPWLESLDLEYHHLDPARGLFHALTPAKRIGEWIDGVRRPEATHVPPADTRAHGRGVAVGKFIGSEVGYVVDWDAISIENRVRVAMPDPFETYAEEVAALP